MTELDGPAVLLLIPVVLLAFAAWWSFVCWMLALVGGWRSLAQRFATDQPAPPDAQLAQGRMGWVQYSGCMQVGGDARGLHLDVLFLFRPGHARLRIPWQQVAHKGQAKRLFVTLELLELGPDRIRLQLPSGAWKHVAPRDRFPGAAPG